MATEPGLPSVMRTRLAAMKAAEAATATPPAAPATTPAPAGTVKPAATPTPVPAVTATPESQTPTPTPTPDNTVTISRDEFNALQANAGKTQAAERRAETERLQREEIALRLTELEKTSKAVPVAPVSAPALETEPVTFTPEEEKDFAESKDYIAKVVRHEIGKIAPQINAMLAKLDEKIKAVEGTATEAASTVQATNSRTFLAHVKEKVPNLEKIKSHANWGDFLDETHPLVGATYEQLLAHNLKQGNLDAVVGIYKVFSDKYLAGVSDVTAGYAGGAPSGTVETPVAAPAVVKLKQSDRRKASDDYKKGRITWEQLQEVDKKFAEAEKNGMIEFD